MADKMVFLAQERFPWVRSRVVSFTYIAGMNIARKRMNVEALHDAYRRFRPNDCVLEISRYSMQEGGVELSAFNLPKFVPSMGRSVSVECAYQGGKVFGMAGPFTELLDEPSGKAQRFFKDKNLGRITGFHFDGADFPASPSTAFYNFIYITALTENPDRAAVLMDYDAFTDTAFNHEKMIGCQAEAAAIYVGLKRAGKLEEAMSSFDRFTQVVYHPPVPAPIPAASMRPAPPAESASLKPKAEIAVGSRIKHPVWGVGSVVRMDGGQAEVDFTGMGVKRLGISWLEKNCAVE